MMPEAKSAHKVQPEREERPVVGKYTIEATQFPPVTLMPLHEDIASGTLGDDKFVISRSVTSLHMFLTVTFKDGEIRREEIDIADLIKKWVQKETQAADAREVAQVLLDMFDRVDDEEKWMWEGAQRMACILLGDNWDGKLD